MKKIIYISTIIILSAISCTEDFYPELDSTFSKVVIQGSINNERKAHQVFITKTSDYFSEEPIPKVTGATVTLSDGENSFTLTEVEDGVYETDTMAGEVGKTYSLLVNTNGMEYMANCYLNMCEPMDSINFGYYDYGDYSEAQDTFLYILMNAQEPATPNNYYLWNVYKNGVLESDTLHEKIVFDDQFVNGNYMYDLAVQWFEGGYNDTITLEMQSITEEYSDYHSQILSQTVYNMGPLSGPAANPVGNIFEVNDNGNDNDNPIGFFLAYSVQRITKIVPPKKEWIELEWY